MLQVGDRVTFVPHRFDSWSYSDSVSNGFSVRRCHDNWDGCLTDEENSAFYDWSQDEQIGQILELTRDSNGKDDHTAIIQLDEPMCGMTEYCVQFYSYEEDLFTLEIKLK